MHENIANTTMKIGGLFDQEGKSSIEYTLGHMDGVQNASVDMISKTVSVEYDSNKITMDMLTGTLNSLGHSILERPSKYEG